MRHLNSDAKLCCILLVLLCGSWQAAEPPSPGVEEDGIAVYFSPHGGCTEAVVAQIGRATKTIDVQAYGFTSLPIARALAEAVGRGVRVRALLDKKATGEHYSGATYLLHHGAAVWLDGRHPIAHNKVIIVDGKTVLTGSFNFTRQAESNAENLLILEGKPRIAAAYEANFERHLEHGEVLKGDAESGRRGDAGRAGAARGGVQRGTAGHRPE